MTDYTKFDSCKGGGRTATQQASIDIAEALDRCLEYHLVTPEVGATIKAYKDGFNDAVIQFQEPYR